MVFNATTITLFNYQYDAAGQRTSVVDEDGNRTTWTYDGASQLLTEHRAQSFAGSTAFQTKFVLNDGAFELADNKCPTRVRYVLDPLTK
ncbi:RHS repeat domain-containing protein [Bremerella sp. T1]|uniref:RHS repeat domain-containing protein n=1 Tax=Bremerella sp. TYQ1 TaxID=3119568 RepID=UPI001CCB5CD2|nr:RHS repeat domain-containing protein [Bremerella volcania]UBM37694.1 RHS repeat protein [Bremerella volcania]